MSGIEVFVGVLAALLFRDWFRAWLRVAPYGYWRHPRTRAALTKLRYRLDVR